MHNEGQFRVWLAMEHQVPAGQDVVVLTLLVWRWTLEQDLTEAVVGKSKVCSAQGGALQEAMLDNLETCYALLSLLCLDPLDECDQSCSLLDF